MASKTSNDTPEKGRRIRLSTLAAQLTQRRAEIREVSVPRNSGKRRTPSKKALLAEIEKAGGRW
jgi:hypothetical protein